MTARRDAALSLAVLGAVAVAWVATGVRVAPLAVGGGAVAVVLVEALLGRSAAAVRTAWERPAVQAVALAATLLGVAAGALVAPRLALSAAVGAVAAYLALLGLVSAGAVGPPEAWW